MSAIDSLITNLDEAQIAPSPVPKDLSEEERWDSDPEEFLRARMRNVRTLPEKLRAVVEEAMKEWKESEENFLGESRSEFLASLAQPIKEYSPKKRLVPDIFWVGERNAQTITVPNIGWVHAFAWKLPLADRKNAAKYGSVGEVMATIMFCEAVIKWRESVDIYRTLRSVAIEFANSAAA
jgi:hypothetical protein